MKKNSLILNQAYERAKEIIKLCSTKNGLFASAGKKGYDAVWSRDSMISLIGASLGDKEKKFKKVFERSLITLASNQSKLGQIPNAVDKFSKRRKRNKVDFQSIDSSLWFIIGEFVYKTQYDDSNLFKRHKKHIEKALIWLNYQDMEEDNLLEQLPTSDWQDAFPHKYGHTINTNALYYRVLKLMKENKKAKKLKFMIDRQKDTKLWNNNFYDAYRWKNHNKYKEIGGWFDSLGNLLAIVFELTDKKKANKILDYIKKKKIDKIYPVKAIYPPIKKDSKYWEDYFNDCDARKPYNYLNGGIWTYIGGFYVLALIKTKKFREAEIALDKLAEANLKGDFPEWINPLTKKSYGQLQAWNAGMYIAAYESFKKKRCLI